MTGESKLANGDSRHFWAAAKDGRLVFQSCAACGAVQFPPRFQCATCWGDDLHDMQSSGRGTIESVTIVRRAPIASYREKVPYCVAAIAVEEGPRMITNLVGPGALDARIGDAVRVCFVANAAGEVLPQFERVGTVTAD